jgi:hypothetical protein
VPTITTWGGPSYEGTPGDDIPAILADYGVTEAEAADAGAPVTEADLQADGDAGAVVESGDASLPGQFAAY